MIAKLITKSKITGDFFNNDFFYSLTYSDEHIIAALARISKGKGSETISEDPLKLIEYLLINQHWSPFEMIDYTFFIETSIAISKQLIRHRSFVFQELSRRYSKRNIFFEDIEIENNEKNKECQEIIKNIEDLTIKAYGELLENDVDYEQARFLLPQHTQTHLYMKGSLRSWLTFLLQRDTKLAQKEIRIIAADIKNELRNHVPNIIEIFYNINKDVFSK